MVTQNIMEIFYKSQVRKSKVIKEVLNNYAKKLPLNMMLLRLFLWVNSSYSLLNLSKGINCKKKTEKVAPLPK
jgi:hypothetical protein